MKLTPLRAVNKPQVEPVGGNLPFFGHVEELRSRLIYCLWALALSFALSYGLAKTIFQVLMRPVVRILEASQGKGAGQLFFTTLSEPFLTDMRVAFFSALLLTSPVFFFNLWKFVAPGLYRRERRALFLVTLFSVLLFAAGIAFGYRVLLPMSFRFFLSFSSSELRPLLTMGAYLGFTTRLLLSSGIMFELPLVILVLAASGVVTARDILGVWRYAVVLVAVVSALITPPDVASMMLMMVPMLALFFMGVLLAALFGRPKGVASKERTN